MLLFKDRFTRLLKNALKSKNFELGESISENEYLVINGTISFNINITEAKNDYERNKSTQKLDELIKKLERDYSVKYSLVTFHNAQQYLRLMLLPSEKVKENYVSLDFIDGVKKVIGFSYDSDTVTPIEDSFLDKWSVPRDVLFAVADRNMCNLLAKTEMRVSVISGGIHVLEFPGGNENIRAALMLCSSFRKSVSEKLGNKFLVVAPSERSLMAVENVTNNIIEAFGPVVVNEYLKADNPIFTDVLLFTQNDITVAGRFRADKPIEQIGDDVIEKEKACC